MRVFPFLLALVLLSGCVPQEETPLETVLVSPSPEPLALSPPPVPSSLPSSLPSLSQKELEAKGLGIVDFSFITAENCDAEYVHLQHELAGLHDNLDETEEELSDEQFDVLKAQQALETAQAANNLKAIEDKEDDLEEEIRDVEAVQDKLDTLSTLEKKYKLVLNSLKDRCKRYKAGNP